MVHDRGIAGRLGIGNLGIGCGERDVPNGLERDAIVPGIEPDQRLPLGGWTVSSRVDVDGLVDRIARGRFQCVLYPAFGIDVIAGRFGIEPHGAVDGGLALASEATNGRHARRNQKPEERATMFVDGRRLNRRRASAQRTTSGPVHYATVRDSR